MQCMLTCIHTSTNTISKPHNHQVAGVQPTSVIILDIIILYYYEELKTLKLGEIWLQGCSC